MDLQQRRIRVIEKTRERYIPRSQWAVSELQGWKARLFDNGVSPRLAAKLAGKSVRTIERHFVDIGALVAVKGVSFGKS